MLVGVPNHRPDQDVNSDAFHSSRGHGSRTDRKADVHAVPNSDVLPDMSVCDRVEKKVREMQKSGKGRSAPKGASPAWMSPDDLYDLPEMKELVDVIMAETGKVLDAFAVKRDSHYITSMWANITHPNHRQDIHVHPNCFLSGLVKRSRLHQDAHELRADAVRFAAQIYQEL